MPPNMQKPLPLFPVLDIKSLSEFLKIKMENKNLVKAMNAFRKRSRETGGLVPSKFSHIAFQVNLICVFLHNLASFFNCCRNGTIRDFAHSQEALMQGAHHFMLAVRTLNYYKNEQMTQKDFCLTLLLAEEMRRLEDFSIVLMGMVREIIDAKQAFE